jgi:hypothetical protein
MDRLVYLCLQKHWEAKTYLPFLRYIPDAKKMIDLQQSPRLAAERRYRWCAVDDGCLGQAEALTSGKTDDQDAVADHLAARAVARLPAGASRQNLRRLWHLVIRCTQSMSADSAGPADVGAAGIRLALGAESGSPAVTRTTFGADRRAGAHRWRPGLGAPDGPASLRHDDAPSCRSPGDAVHLHLLRGAGIRDGVERAIRLASSGGEYQYPGPGWGGAVDR